MVHMAAKAQVSPWSLFSVYKIYLEQLKHASFYGLLYTKDADANTLANHLWFCHIPVDMISIYNCVSYKRQSSIWTK